MNRNFLSWRACLAWVAILMVPVIALAQSPHEGIFLGTYEGTFDIGEFALIIDEHGRGTIAAYDTVDDQGYVEKYIRIRSDGSFQFMTLHGAHVDGQVTETGVDGRYVTGETEGTFTGARAAHDGPLLDAAGYYSGPVAITGISPDGNITVSSRLVAIIAADGSAFFLLERAFPGFGGNWTGGRDFDLDLGLDLDLDLDLGLGLDLGFNFGSDFPFGPGFDPVPPFDTDFNPPFPFGSGFNPPFPFGHGFNTSFHIGSGFGFNSSFHLSPGHCSQSGFGYGWPFNVGLEYSLSLSFLGLFDLDLDFNLPTCGFFEAWEHFATAIGASGGFVQVAPDGEILGTFADGLELLGYLDIETASAEGILFQQLEDVSWTGDWLMERQESPAGLHATKLHSRLTDINGDGLADIIWRHEKSGENAVWLMNGAGIAAEFPLQLRGDLQGDSEWVLAAVIELNEDQQPDLVWRHSVTGALYLWLGDEEPPVHFDLDPDWQILGRGDFDAEAGPEFFVRHRKTGANALLTGLPGALKLTPFLAMDDPAWSPVAVADFNGDANPDVLWVNRQSSDVRILLLEGQTLVNELQVFTDPSHQYELSGTGDLDGDGTTDILWRDPVTGDLGVTLRLVGEPAEVTQLGSDMTPAWRLAAVGDLNGDGTDDLVWRNALSGENTAWLMAGQQVAEAAPLMVVPDQHWTIRP